jgi:hypothetical protein
LRSPERTMAGASQARHNRARSGGINEAAHRSFDFASVSARRRDVQVMLVAEYHASFAMTLSSSPDPWSSTGSTLAIELLFE